jgi:cell division protein FtsL
MDLTFVHEVCSKSVFSGQFSRIEKVIYLLVLEQVLIQLWLVIQPIARPYERALLLDIPNGVW